MLVYVYGVLGPLVGGLANKYGCRPVTVCGSVLAASSIVISSFSTHINVLIATYGLLAGHFSLYHLHIYQSVNDVSVYALSNPLK